MTLSCSKFGPAAAQNYYSFKQRDGEAVEDFAIRAMQQIRDAGVNRIAYYRGTNHVYASNAAGCFPKDVLEDLAQSDRQDVRNAATVIGLWQEVSEVIDKDPQRVSALKDQIDAVLGIPPYKTAAKSYKKS